MSPAPSGARPRRIIRAPNHLGDVVAALPALAEDGSDVLVVRRLAPLLEMAHLAADVIAFDRGPRGFARATRELRRRGYDEGVLLSAAFSAAWLFRWGGVRRLRGTATDGRSLLLTERVAPGALRPHHRVNAYRVLLGQAPTLPAAGYRLRPGDAHVSRWRARLPAGDGPLVGLFPGANAPARRWPEAGFTALAREISSRGARIVVLGGPAERGLTARVARAAGGALDAGGGTDLPGLAAVLSLCDLVVTNDTGPMHLAGAVGTPTVTVWGPSDPAEVRQLGSRDFAVSGAPIPCKPCRRNRCARRGRGTMLEDGHEECMRLIEVNDVLEAVESALGQELQRV